MFSTTPFPEMLVRFCKKVFFYFTTVTGGFRGVLTHYRAQLGKKNKTKTRISEMGVKGNKIIAINEMKGNGRKGKENPKIHPE